MSNTKIDFNKLKFKKEHSEAIIPKYAKAADSGFDFYALIINEKDSLGNKTDGVLIAPCEQKLIRTGVSCSIPIGYEIQIRPKSGLAAKYGITITNTPGTIDAGYVNREIKVILKNTGQKVYKVKHQEKIAQGVFAPVVQADIEEVEEFTEEDMKKDRGGGFGSTGIR